MSIEITGNLVGVTFNNYFSVIFAYESIEDLIDRSTNVFLHAQLRKIDFNKQKQPNNQSFYQPVGEAGFGKSPFSNINNLFGQPQFKPTYETPFNNYSNINYNKPSPSFSQFDDSFQQAPKSAINFNANSSLFSKRNFENDKKCNNDGFLSNPSYGSLKLNVQAPVYYPPNYSQFLNQNIKSPIMPELHFEEEPGKFVTSYEVQIENDEKFKVTKRIIGLKGNNMKKILSYCKVAFPYISSNDLLKIRLRGRGSGYKEGLNNKGKLYFLL